MVSLQGRGMDSTNDSLLKNARFLRLWIGQGTSFLGDAVSMVALVVLVVQVTGSASAVGGALIARLLPTLASPLAGVLADRLDRRLVLVASDLARAVLVLGLIFATDLATIYVLVFLYGSRPHALQPHGAGRLPERGRRGGPHPGQRPGRRHVQRLGDGRSRPRGPAGGDRGRRRRLRARLGDLPDLRGPALAHPPAAAAEGGRGSRFRGGFEGRVRLPGPLARTPRDSPRGLPHRADGQHHDPGRDLPRQRRPSTPATPVTVSSSACTGAAWCSARP